MTTTLTELEKRVALIERDRRFWKTVAWTAILAFVLAFAMGAAALRSVEGQRFVLRDARGVTRVDLGPGPGGLACLIHDTRGKGKVRVGINDDGTFSLSVLDQAPAPGQEGKKPAR